MLIYFMMFIKLDQHMQRVVSRGVTEWGGETLPSQNSKCHNLPKFQFSFDPLLGGGEVLQTNIPEILEWGHSRNFEPNFQPLQLAHASQIVSHILRMWRLITIRV